MNGMNKAKLIEKIKVQLENEVRELKAMLASTYHFATQYVPKLGTDHRMASGVLVCLYNVGGAEACLPFFIRDGFSQETINGLMADLNRSYERATEFKPLVMKDTK